MCWSAGTDLVMGSAITAVGIASVASVRRINDLPMALLPVVLGAHQLIEAVVWQGETGDVSAGTAEIAREAWAVIAFPLLPAFVPLAVLAAQWPLARGRERVRATFFIVLGLVVAGALGHALVSRPVNAEICGNTVRYSVGIPAAPWVIAGYLVATLGSLLLARDRLLRLLGLVCAVGAAITMRLWFHAFASTWCAVAAAASVIVLWWVRSRRPAPPGSAGSSPGPVSELVR
ncbi:DUF6629 family protein [Embleya hyalina]|uniref:DUF998 domain-containing protein n=1 Tax=Embleya hyalina TaxID=516124 RepID=A0A401Z451_9ACTN|nr:DUF6629 family protein [Embleya hyalina]GCE01618.1 hypothetical protein EHYA_09385 [Embleya hyalina]